MVHNGHPCGGMYRHRKEMETVSGIVRRREMKMIEQALANSILKKYVSDNATAVGSHGCFIFYILGDDETRYFEFPVPMTSAEGRQE